MKEFVVKEDKAFRLRVKQWRCKRPENMFALEFVQECLNEEGSVDFSSTYQFFMTEEEIETLCKGLLK